MEPVTPEEARLAAEIALAPMRSALEQERIDLAYLAKKLKRELSAKETKFFQKDGVVIEQRDVVAWEVRQRARMDAHKLLGHYPPEKHDVDVTHGFKNLSDEQLNGLIEKLEGRNGPNQSEPGK